jgi:hypothetical protein
MHIGVTCLSPSGISIDECISKISIRAGYLSAMLMLELHDSQGKGWKVLVVPRLLHSSNGCVPFAK